ncbi:hypothetical protein MVES1_001604 [Malassezia vespertilionis]|uniref:uncharacterized protein n=1 Tax=Malassezia vespertilionis TaxID=2020962 RepID=UPI0024B1C7A6|nr:uncharacterized protein MVES1_001604 [Malassezia vespertilionis]WFD06259.1 hypothetical protein MVES1_001604 [Malassezia vespertilionis]
MPCEERKRALLAYCSDALRQHFASREDGEVHVHAVFSRPVPTHAVYPLAHVQLHEWSDALPVWQEQVVLTASWKPCGGEARMIYALEAYIYTILEFEAALLYISKLDSTGFGPNMRGAPSLPMALTAGFLHYFIAKAHWPAKRRGRVLHVSVHVLARAQPAYLFPNSPQHRDKRVISDAALIRWWRLCLSEALSYTARCDTEKIHAFYTIPGFARNDSHPIAPLVRPGNYPSGSRMAKLADAQWVYGHPYSAKGASCSEDALPPLPLHIQPQEARRTLRVSQGMQQRTLATLVPIFPDDPKGRFLNELLGEAHDPSYRPPVLAQASSVAQREALRERQALDRTSVDAFWEQMGFRQECSAGNAVGVFVVQSSTLGSSEAVETAMTMDAQPCALPHGLLDELVLKCLLRDSCNWADATETVRLTKQYYEEFASAVARRGNREPGSAQGIPSVRLSIQATPAHDEKCAQDAAAQATRPPAGSGDLGVRVLSVKRKRRS